MKLQTLSKVLILFALTIPAIEARCPMDLCRGDNVASENGWEGEVLGVNPHKNKVSVRWFRNESGYSRNTRGTYRFKELYVSNICLGHYCTGSNVVSSGGWEGKIIGLNRSKKKVAVRWHRNTEGYSRNTRSTVSKRSLALAKGCFNGLCIDDEVISPNGWEGKVLAINRHNNQAGVRWYRNSSGYSRNTRSMIPIEDLSISRYCLDYSDNQRYSEVDYDRNEQQQNHSRYDDSQGDHSDADLQYYTVKSGDTLLAIALRFGISLSDLVKLNVSIAGDLDSIRVGLRIRIK